MSNLSNLTEKEKREAVRDNMSKNLAEALKKQGVHMTEGQIKAVFEDISASCDSCDLACKHFVII